MFLLEKIACTVKSRTRASFSQLQHRLLLLCFLCNYNTDLIPVKIFHVQLH